jgi:hypothetical protein
MHAVKVYHHQEPLSAAHPPYCVLTRDSAPPHVWQAGMRISGELRRLVPCMLVQVPDV